MTRFSLLIALAFAFVATPMGVVAGGKSPTLAEDVQALQGVWESTPGTKKQLQIMFLGDKIGYRLGDPTAKPGTPLDAFMALSTAQYKEAAGKRYFAIEIAKDTVRRLDYRLESGEVWIGLNGKDFNVKRVNARASTSPPAKKLLGTWKVIAGEFQGKERPAKAMGLNTIVFTEDRYILQGPGGKEILSSFYRFGANKTPATMDWYGMKTDYIIPLIYEVKGDELRLAHPPFNLVSKGAPRPTTFDTAENDAFVVRAKRAP